MILNYPVLLCVFLAHLLLFNYLLSLYVYVVIAGSLPLWFPSLANRRKTYQDRMSGYDPWVTSQCACAPAIRMSQSPFRYQYAWHKWLEERIDNIGMSFQNFQQYKLGSSKFVWPYPFLNKSVCFVLYKDKVLWHDPTWRTLELPSVR